VWGGCPVDMCCVRVARSLSRVVGGFLTTCFGGCVSLLYCGLALVTVLCLLSRGYGAVVATGQHGSAGA